MRSPLSICRQTTKRETNYYTIFTFANQTAFISLRKPWKSEIPAINSCEVNKKKMELKFKTY